MRDLLSPGVLKRSLAWNAGGTLLPLVASVLAVPFLIRGLGEDRFGLLTMVWALVGYASLFDLGLGRALTLLVADRIGRQRNEDLHPLFWSAFWLLTALGTASSLALFVAAPQLVSWIQTPPALAAEAVGAFRILAVGLPLVFVTSALTGVLAALQRFDVMTLVRMPLGLATTVGPLLLLLVSPSLVWISVLLLVVRALTLVIFAWWLRALVPGLMKPVRPHREMSLALIGHGGWMTVSNVVGPLLTYLDRFFVGAIVGTAAVARYVTPYEVVTRLNFIPGILLGVLFPALATAYASNPDRAVSLYRDAAIVLRHVLLAICALIFLFAEELLSAWIGADFGREAAPVARWLAVGLWANVLAHTPFAFLQSAGRSDLIAKVHLSELVPYLLVVIWWTREYGIEGTAAAWTLRAAVDMFILNQIASRIHPALRAQTRSDAWWLVGGLAAFAGMALIHAASERAAALIVVWVFCGWILLPFARRVAPGRGVHR